MEALLTHSREPLNNVDNAMDVMYDPLRHNPFNGGDFVDEVAGLFQRDFRC
jgi:hypothetical protein